MDNQAPLDGTDIIIGFDDDINEPNGISILKERDYLSVLDSHPLSRQGYILLADLVNLRLIIIRGLKRHREYEIRIRHDNPNAEFIYVDNVYEMLQVLTEQPDSAVIWSAFQYIRPNYVAVLPLESPERTLKLWIRNKNKPGVSEFVELFKTIWGM